LCDVSLFMPSSTELALIWPIKFPKRGSSLYKAKSCNQKKFKKPKPEPTLPECSGVGYKARCG